MKRNLRRKEERSENPEVRQMYFEDWVENTFELENNPPLGKSELKEAWNKAIEMALNECATVVKNKQEGVGAKDIMDVYSKIKKLHT